MQRQLRLRHDDDFRRLREQGDTFQDRALVLSLVPNQCAHNRYGVIVTRRLGKAVVRNRVRRQLRACLRQLHSALLPGYDVVVIARRMVLRLSYAEMLSSLESLFRAANLWKGTA